MTNNEQINLARARLSYLNGQMAVAVATGDSERIKDLESEIARTESRIADLDSIQLPQL